MNQRASVPKQSEAAQQSTTNAPSATHSAPAPHMLPAPHAFSRVRVGIQRNLMVNQPGDRYEQEAERIAAAVAEGGDSILTAPEAGRFVQRQVDGIERGDNAPSIVDQTLRRSGQPLDGATRSFMEQRLGHDFSRVRVHSDDQAATSAHAIGARAYTHGSNIVFGAGQYAPETAGGQRLIAHELTHVVQQGAAQPHGAHGSPVVQRAPNLVQRGLLGDLWSGIRSVGRAIGGAARTAANWIGGAARTAADWIGGAFSTATNWLAERARDASMWVINLIRDLPARLARLAQTLWEGLSGVVTFIPEAIMALRSGGIRGFAGWLWEKAKRGGAWLLTLVARVFDTLGGPELVEFVTHILTRATPLTDAEKTAAKSVLGPSAIRYDDVRVAESGLLSIIFRLNNGRAFATFHTINLPSTGAHGRSNVAIVVHELTHVYQYEKVGTLYLGQAIHAQATIGYGYGGAAGLQADRAAGKRYRDYNREQQAQIAQDYYTLKSTGGTTADYDPFIAELRAGDL